MVGGEGEGETRLQPHVSVATTCGCSHDVDDDVRAS